VDEVGQAVEVRFIAPAAGRHDLQLYVMPDSWLGADRVLPLKLRTVEPSRAEREGRVGRAAAAPAPAGKPLQRSQESEALLGGGGGGEDEGSDAGGGRRGSGSEGSGSEEEEEGEGEEEGAEWDSDEYGTEETGSEASDEARDD
jgi:translocation protein SEC63